VQYHHAIYPKGLEEIVGVTAGHLFKGEHGIITALRRQTRNVSEWFMTCLRQWLIETLETRELRDLNKEITDLPEGQSWHCKYCGKGFLVKKNRGVHEQVCARRGDLGWQISDSPTSDQNN